MLLAKKLCDCWNGVSDPDAIGWTFDAVVGGLELVEPKEPAGESKLPFSDVIVAIRISAMDQRYEFVLVEVNLILFLVCYLRVSGRRSGRLPLMPSGRKLDMCGPRPNWDELSGVHRSS